MTYLSELGLLSLGSQLKGLSDQLYSAADEVYRRHGMALQGRWFPVLRLLNDRGPMTVGEIARTVGQTHSAISQLATRLTREGWVTTSSDAVDRRTRRLTLTEKSVAALGAAQPLWRAIRETIEDRARDAGLDAGAVLEGLGKVAGPGLADAIVERLRGGAAQPVRIEQFRPELRDHFYRLNADWLERLFRIESFDVEVLRNPEQMILEAGGSILFALHGEEVVGTCALMPAGRGEYELTKMAVDPSMQGQGIGRALLDAAIAEFERLAGRMLFLETSTKLAPAVRLYESAGFEHQPTLRPGSHYARANVYMIWRGRPARKRLG